MGLPEDEVVAVKGSQFLAANTSRHLGKVSVPLVDV